MYTVYNQYSNRTIMIESFTHKGLKLFWTKGDKSKIPSAMLSKIERVLFVINNIRIIPDDLEGLSFLKPHPLKGDLLGFWAMSITGNWRIIFKFDNQSSIAYDVDLVDYH